LRRIHVFRASSRFLEGDSQTQPSTSFETKMADPEVRISIGDSGANEDDIEMQGDNADVIEVGETGADGGQSAREEEGMTMEEEKPASRVTFVEYVSRNDFQSALFAKLAKTNHSYLKSPIVELVIGSAENQSKLSAHQALLGRSPFLAEALTDKQVRLWFSRSFPDSCLLALWSLGRPHRPRRRRFRSRWLFS